MAAITIPTLVNKYKRFELKNRFTKTSAVVENALKSTMSEYSMEFLLKKETNELINEMIPNEERNEINEYFASQLQVSHTLELKTFDKGADWLSDEANKQKVYSYKSGEHIPYYYLYNHIGAPAYLLSDGSVISIIKFQKHGEHDGVKVYFDTNGPFKGPNRYGYDIFIYNSGGWGGRTSCNDTLFYGCYNYALKNENPDDKPKGYWDSLKF